MNSSGDLPGFFAKVEVGARVLQDGWVGVFYLPSPCSKHQAIVSDCILDYLKLADSKDLRWTIDEDGDAVELTADEIERKLEALGRPNGTSVGFRLGDNPAGVSGFRVRYIGVHPSDPMVVGLQDAVSLLLLTYPTEAVEAIGLDAIVQFHDSVAGRLPLSTGYTSPAFLFAPGAGEPAAFEVIRRLSSRYRCIDIPYVSIECFELGRKVKGAYWLNYLGADAVSALGGVEAIENALSGKGVKLRALPGDLTAIQVDAPPSAGDSNRRDDLSAYMVIAEAIKPLQYRPSVSFPEFELEETIEWFQRFAPPPD